MCDSLKSTQPSASEPLPVPSFYQFSNFICFCHFSDGINTVVCSTQTMLLWEWLQQLWTVLLHTRQHQLLFTKFGRTQLDCVS